MTATACISGPTVSIPRHASVPALVFEQARLSSNKLALIQVGTGNVRKTITYQDLLVGVQLTTANISKQAERRTSTGICFIANRSIKTILAILGAAASGVIVSYIDPTLKDALLASRICGQKDALFVTDKECAVRLDTIGVPHLTLDDLFDTKTPVHHELQVGSETPFFSVWSSGSTGMPKNFVIPHRTFLNSALQEATDAGAVYAQHSSFGFVDGLWEFLIPLMLGSTVVIIPDSYRLQKRFFLCMSDHEVDRIQLVPTLLRQFFLRPGDLRLCGQTLDYWVTSGEVLGADLIEQFERHLPWARLYNSYGLSEYLEISLAEVTRHAGDFIPVGLPIVNTTIKIVDSSGAVLCRGEKGEVVVGGSGSALRMRMDGAGGVADKNVIDVSDNLISTGDCGFIDYDGVLYITGRSDSEIKIHGKKVDVHSLQQRILGMTNVTDCVVAKLNIDSLVAFVEVTDLADTELEALKGSIGVHLKEFVEPHEIPERFRFLLQFPTTSSGKVDVPRLIRESDLESIVGLTVSATSLSALGSSTLVDDCCKAVASARQLDAVEKDAPFESVCRDSLDYVAVAVALSDVLNVEITTDLLLSCDSVSDLVERVG